MRSKLLTPMQMDDVSVVLFCFVLFFLFFLFFVCFCLFLFVFVCFCLFLFVTGSVLTLQQNV